MRCELCDRVNEVNYHHLIPVSQHTNKWFKARFTRQELSAGINICTNDCHRYIHEIMTEKQMGKFYNTKKLLLTHPKVKKYVKWIQKQKI